MSEAQVAAIVNRIIQDLNGRSGFSIASLDEETQAEIRETWEELVREESER